LIEFKFIKEEDIPTLKYKKLDWDVVTSGGREYQIIKVPGFVHTIGGHLDHGEGNCYWAYPLGEELSYKNIVQFNGTPGARWGFEFRPTHYIRNKYDDVSIECGRKLIITRNDEPFYDGLMTIHDAMAYVLDGKLNDHPLDLNVRDYHKKCIGRKVWYRSQPAIITDFTRRRACVTLKPDGKDRFDPIPEYDDFPMEDDREVFTSIFDEHVYWFRD
jgi:hypothetical protein